MPAVITGGKTGWVYVHDRATGKLIRRSDAMIPHENLFTQPTEAGVRMLPGANGGVEWSPGAFNPETRLVYYSNLHQPMTYTVKKEPWQKGKLWLGGAFTAIPGEDQWGNVSAVNVDTGKIVWQARSEDPMIGGTLTTAGNLTFAGEGDGSFNAYDAATGAKLWSFQAGAGVNSAPMSFQIDGKQYIAVAAGGNFQLNYKLGELGPGVCPRLRWSGATARTKFLSRSPTGGRREAAPSLQRMPKRCDPGRSRWPCWRAAGSAARRAAPAPPRSMSCRPG